MQELHLLVPLVSFLLDRLTRHVVRMHPLTLTSADMPLSVSFKELHGNWPVTLYMFRVRLKQMQSFIVVRMCANTQTHHEHNIQKTSKMLTYLRSKCPGWGLKKDKPYDVSFVP